MKPRERDTLRFIEVYMATSGGVSPSLAEIARGVDMKAVSAVKRIVDRLVADGAITKVPNEHRSIKIVRGSDANCPTCGKPYGKEHAHD